MSRILKTAILSAASLALAAAANAGDYGQTYGPSAYGQSSYSQSTYGGVMSQYEASARYGSGSISDSYTDGNVEIYGFSGTLPGLGHNESLQATNCPTAVYNPEGGRVLGCYNVVKPVPKTTYYRIVRPVIYVRYPVCCAPIAPPPRRRALVVLRLHPRRLLQSRAAWHLRPRRPAIADARRCISVPVVTGQPGKKFLIPQSRRLRGYSFRISYSQEHRLRLGAGCPPR